MKRNQCVQCGKYFQLSDSEIKFYESKNLSLPKRCKECREKNKASKNKKDYFNDEKILKPQYDEYTVKYNDDKRSSIVSSLVFLASIIITLLIFGFENIFWCFLSSVIICSVAATIFVPKKELIIKEFDTSIYSYNFYSNQDLVEHYIKHHSVVNESSMEDYLFKANMLIKNPKAQHKKRWEDGDDIYFNSKTGEIAIVARAGYLRTYFISTQKYFDKQ